MQIPNGYKVLIVSPEGEVIETIEIGGYDLDKPLAKVELIREISDEVKKHVVSTIKL